MPREWVDLARACRPSSYVGFHRARGLPIFVERLGCIDVALLERAGLPEETVLRYHLREMEFMTQVCY